MKVLDIIALILLIGLFNFNLVDTIFGAMSIVSRIIYTLVGFAGLYSIKFLFNRT